MVALLLVYYVRDLQIQYKYSDPKDLLWKIPQQAILNLQNQDIEKNLHLLILDEVSNITA